MKSLFRKMGAWWRRTWVWTLSWVLFIGLLVWFVGPLLAVADYKFWASPTARLLTISVMFLAWGLGMVFYSERVSESEKKTDANSPRTCSRTRIDDQRRELRSRFKKALETLKTSSLYSGYGKYWRDDLPWYLVMGPAASGKTSLLACSGLEFAFDRFERNPSEDACGTQHCDWYFAQQAVLVDTPGRYLTQADPDVDADAWSGLLEWLRKRRRHCPLNGVLLTVPVEVLLGSEDEVTRLASHIRARLQDIQRQLRADLPVYLVLSKADYVPGFNEFFDSMTREESDQVLGASFGRGPHGNDVTVSRTEFESLLHRLNSQLLTRLHQERDAGRRGLILDFPQQLAQMGAHLCLLLEQVSSGKASPIRGFYLTCALRPGAAAASPGDASPGTRRELSRSSREGINSRFIHHLLTRVIFPEADLARLGRSEHRRIRWNQRMVYFAAMAPVGLFGLLWAQGFSANHERLEHLWMLGQRWEQLRLAPVASDDSIALLDSLDVRFDATQVFAPEKAVPLHERIRLYQGDATSPVVVGAYEHELQSQLLPRVAKMLEEHIQGNLGDRERLLNSLRAYLMLARPERREAAWLKDRLARDWSLRYPGNPALQNGLNTHFERLLDLPLAYEVDESLVAQARKILRGESLADVVYRMLREQANPLPPYSLSQHLGPQGALLVGTDQIIPGFYTRQGYEQYFSVQGTTLITGLLQDNWVLGEGANPSGMDMRRLMSELEQLYFRDYAERWSEAIGRVSLRRADSTSEAAGQLAELTSAYSPLVQLLVQVREHTRIQGIAERMDEATQTTGNSSSTVLHTVALAGKAATSVAARLPEVGQKSLQRRFEPLHRLLDAEGGPAGDLTLALRALDDVDSQLATLTRASAPEQAAFELARHRMGVQQDALSNLRSASTRLPRPLSGWLNGLAEDSWRLVLDDSYRYLNQRYQSELYTFYAKAINKRYPFNAHSASDVAINDFREFFKDQGIVDRFFERYMRPFVSGHSGHYRLRSVDGQSLPMSRAYLEQMATTHTIRQSFFAEDPVEPKVQFKLEPYTLDPAVSRSELRLGDQTLEYRHGPIQPVAFTWPIEAQDGRAALVLDRIVGGQGVGIEKSTGPWSLFRLFDLMQMEYLVGRDVRVLKADLGGLRANYLLMSQRTPNPFDMSTLRTFRMPVQL
ncbi:type VI secretion system membrane subunit TssM [Pseudomonas sp. FP198]|uniref:type VI secretion system membrane subunit TssM n=1 Tax=Pseudomonas sp. FP198 TaxID=2954084 RepID=UPI00273317C4|nr:type VI secretion system membrane subunit TssM [Pseudomonas sp. FP198]WLG95720.1 type VI secretion system membrane subunit TssM [Pseudomonas sp. FP198]